MKTTLLFVLTLSGLCALSTNIIREYHYVKMLKTWAEAQSYCRDTFTDLATVHDKEDNDRLMRVQEGHGKYAWIGLYDDIKGWKWALGDKDLNDEFSNWRENEPNNRARRLNCVFVSQRGLWFDVNCGGRRPAVCYSEKGPSRYILVETQMTWMEARRHCRSSYTDLATVRNRSENNEITSLLPDRSWIGLYRRSWVNWSDETPRTFSNWHTKQPVNSGGTMRSCVVVNTTTGTWFNAHCEEKNHFICQTVSYPPTQHKTTLKLKFRSEADLNDPAVQQQMLEQLHAKLEKRGLSDFKLRWIQTDGQTFHKEEKKKKDKGLCALSTNIIREYHYVKMLKTWAEAQSYCRDTFTDLATVHDKEDNDRLMRVQEGHGKYAWIGLYDDIKGWKWALGDKDLNDEFSNWRENEPNNMMSKQGCVVMTQDGFWDDNSCMRTRPAVCYNAAH
ncbi:macrophage mannose receptor 1-like [Epinephelus lanceolatus]